MNDCRMNNFKMWSGSSGEAVASHYWARSAHESHV